MCDVISSCSLRGRLKENPLNMAEQIILNKYVHPDFQLLCV